MMASERRGRPLQFLVLLLGSWMALRAGTWSTPFLAPPAEGILAFSGQMFAAPAALALAMPVPEQGPALAAARSRAPAKPASMPGLMIPFRPPRGANSPIRARLGLPSLIAMPKAPPVPPRPNHDGAGQGASKLAARPAVRRWSFDLWGQWRPDTGFASAAVAPAASLGGSQAGVIARYSFDRGPHEASVFLRIAGAPGHEDFAGEREGALGLRVRPFARLPIQIQGELRLRHLDEGVDLAPAALMAGSVEDVPLACGMRLRSYAAAGWVGGRYATAFAEGQAVTEIEVANFEKARLDLGMGAWGGAQRDASRLDFGPSLALRLPFAAGAARLQLDYRLRAAGSAEPGSGPALTLSAGF